jgi:D-xylose transport system ATP-binding protein
MQIAWISHKRAIQGEIIVEKAWAVEMKNITKKFSGVRALNDVSLQIEKGDIHALIGENGAGKSTLMNVLCGKFAHNSYDGSVSVDGAELKLNSPREAFAAGVVMVHQELALIPELSIAENMFLGNMPMKNGSVDWNKTYKSARETLKMLSLDMDVRNRVKYLSIGQQQLVEIAKAISHGGKVMILDEPTAPLTGREIRFMFDILRDLKSRGITIIYITHRLDEVFELTDKVSVMRDGRMIVSANTREVSQHDLVSYMIGREMQDFYPKEKTIAGEEVLKIRDYSVAHPTYAGKNIVDGVSMEFREGEIVGIAGLLGSGRTELMSAVVGSYVKKGKGTIALKQKEIQFRNCKQAIAKGIGFVTEDRKGNGLILKQTISFNASLAALSRITRNRILNRKKEMKLVSDFVQQLKIKTNNVQNPVSSLSGGNQQKVVIAKWLATMPKLLILDEPTRGVDVGAKYEIYTIMKDLAKSGVSVIMISSDLPEIIGMSDRVYVMKEGKVTAELQKEDLSEETIMGYATGAFCKIKECI